MERETQFTHDTYLSPFIWRYGSQEMRALCGRMHRRLLWRRVWVALATVQHQAGLVTAGQLADLRVHQDDVGLARAAQIEAEIHRDRSAEAINAHNTFDQPAAIKPAAFDGATLTGGALLVNLPAESAVVLRIE